MVSLIKFTAMISFENTEIAFGYKSNKDLKRAHRLFQLVGKPWLVRFGKWITPIAFKLKLPIQGIIKSTIFSQFCGGESINECDTAIATLYQHRVGTILDYSVEGKVEEDDQGKVNSSEFNERMGYLGSVSEMKKTLEKIYKIS